MSNCLVKVSLSRFFFGCVLTGSKFSWVSIKIFVGSSSSYAPSSSTSSKVSAHIRHLNDIPGLYHDMLMQQDVSKCIFFTTMDIFCQINFLKPTKIKLKLLLKHFAPVFTAGRPIRQSHFRQVTSDKSLPTSHFRQVTSDKF
ncbi:hypothetical protein BpHYR1_042084 [Brachionus plicatilis]|uniref:Uncharacterized protein n=1 Tax=Brachionus plicatilis TaxID=10195 RepID=A0A3M7QX62_BRAPC|nr:hypothetical protein BpHYR1_042084 [Brachionus plicatilis]